MSRFAIEILNTDGSHYRTLGEIEAFNAQVALGKAQRVFNLGRYLGKSYIATEVPAEDRYVVVSR